LSFARVVCDLRNSERAGCVPVGRGLPAGRGSDPDTCGFAGGRGLPAWVPMPRRLLLLALGLKVPTRRTVRRISVAVGDMLPGERGRLSDKAGSDVLSDIKWGTSTPACTVWYRLALLLAIGEWLAEGLDFSTGGSGGVAGLPVPENHPEGDATVGASLSLIWMLPSVLCFLGARQLTAMELA